MAGDAQSPGMRNAVSVNEQQVRFLRKLLPRRQQRRRFAKREKAGNIGHRGGDPRHLILHQLKLRPVSSTIAARVIPFLLKPDVRAADQRRRVAIQSIRTLYRRG